MTSCANTNTNMGGTDAGDEFVIDFRCIPTFVPSMCINSVHPNVTPEFIKEVISTIGFGDVRRVDVIKVGHRDSNTASGSTKTTGIQYNRAFIHFNHWSPHARSVRTNIMCSKPVRVTYQIPGTHRSAYWKLNGSWNGPEVNPIVPLPFVPAPVSMTRTAVTPNSSSSTDSDSSSTDSDSSSTDSDSSSSLSDSDESSNHAIWPEFPPIDDSDSEI
jgi:hypothetical protein